MNKRTLWDMHRELVSGMEPPMIYQRWSLISLVATHLGRNCWLQFGADRIFPNQYIMLVGNPGTRKSTSIRLSKKLLRSTGYENFSVERTSKEQFLMSLQGDSSGIESNEIVTNLFGASDGDQIPREVFVCADEFNEFVGSGNTEFLSMLGAIWDWDDPAAPYKQKLKISKSAVIYQPTVNILSGNTHAGLTEAFPVNILGQGFMSRLILVYSEPSGRKVTIPPIPSASLLEEMTAELLKIKDVVRGEISYTKSAFDALDSIYKSWPELEDIRFKHYSTRRLTHLLKLCLVCVAIAKRTRIEMTDVLYANTILSWVERDMHKAIGELGRKKGSDVSSSIMSMLYEATKAVTMSEMFTRLEQDLDGIHELSKILKSLYDSGKIQAVDLQDTNVKGYLPKNRRLKMEQHLYVDLKLLKGMEYQ